MPLKTHMDEQPTLNLTPMIDITFLIVIFFLVGAQLVEVEKQLEVDVPQVAEAGTPLTAAPERKIVNIARSGAITLDQEAVTLPQLTARLTAERQQYEDLGVIVRGDAHGDSKTWPARSAPSCAAGINDMGIAVRLTEDQP